MTKFTIKGIGTEIDLTQREFIAKGGEGSVYGKGNVAYKVYEDPANMLPVAKIQELSVLQNNNIIRPDRILLDKKDRPVGYSMRLVQGGALCQLFTKAYRQRNNIDNDRIIHLTKDLYSLVDYIHQKGILVVDLNELNFLVDPTHNEIYAIDVNSYQTPSFPATVIMPSIRDRHCKAFSKETDWFSWGIITFQMFIGIHPYKGNHPDFEKLALDERIDARMKKNVSVFNTKATFPKVCNPFDVIPPALRSWYKAVFEDGKRVAPPKDFVAAAYTLVIKQLAGSNQFEIVEVDNYPSDIVSFYAHEGNRVVLTDKTIHLNKKQYNIPTNDVHFTFTAKLNHPFAVYLENGIIQILDVQKHAKIPFNMAASAIMTCNGRIYVQSGTNVLELNFTELGNNVQVSSKLVGRVLDLPGSTQVFDGVVIQNLLGRYHASLFPSAGKCYQFGFPELDRYTIQEAKYENNVLVVVGVDRKSGKYDRFVMRFDPEFKTYDLRKVENITFTGINFTVSDAGACILLTEDEKVEVFSNKKDSGSVKIIDDPAIESDMKLCHDGTKILFTRGKKLHSFSMKKSNP